MVENNQNQPQPGLVRVQEHLMKILRSDAKLKASEMFVQLGTSLFPNSNVATFELQADDPLRNPFLIETKLNSGEVSPQSITNRIKNLNTRDRRGECDELDKYWVYKAGEALSSMRSSRVGNVAKKSSDIIRV